jgi:uncharacterized protein YtpQ (UPF0354 family)
MWLWAFVGWCAVAAVVVLLHRRFRALQPSWTPEVAAFLVRLETELSRARPQVEFAGMLPGQFACLLRLQGQETPVSLHEAYRHAQAFPDAFPRMVERLVRDIREVGLDRVDDLDFAAAAPLLLPQVRSRAWLDEHGCFGDSGLAHTRLNDELVVVYVIDDPHCMVFVCRAHLQRWRKSELDLHNLALANLARLGNAGLDKVGAAAEPLLLQSGDGYDAARVLLLDQVDGLLVAIPDRDVLWVGNEKGQDLAELMATTEEIARTAAHPVSSHLWRVRAGQLEPVAGSR